MTGSQPMGFHGWPDSGKAQPDASRERFRHNLAQIMSDRGITQAALARMMVVSRVAVHAWIWGTCFPETSRLLKLAQVLNVQVGTLLEGDTAAAAANHDSSSDEALLLDAFRKLPSNARLTLLADVFELSAQAAMQAPAPTAADTAS